jgi:hypothetical protein
MENEGLETDYEIIYKFDDYIDSQIQNKKTIFFDLMIWNYFADERLPLFKQLKTKIYSLVDQNKIICPISASLIVEAAKNSDKNTVNKVFEIMDYLSKKVCIAHPNIILIKELRPAILLEYFNEGTTKIHEMKQYFCHAFEAFSDGQMTLTWPKGTPADIPKLKKLSDEKFEQLLKEPLLSYLSLIRGNLAMVSVKQG